MQLGRAIQTFRRAISRKHTAWQSAFVPSSLHNAIVFARCHCHRIAVYRCAADNTIPEPHSHRSREWRVNSRVLAAR